jgi:glycosyltransferase involved in cell wall biosynthesis
MDIVLLSTAWGAKHGGINAFNRDFALGLAAALGTDGRVFCAVLDPSDRDIEAARQARVTIAPIRGKRHSDRFDPSWSYEVTDWMKQRGINPANLLWVGHDLVTGDVALKGAEINGGQAALLMHMSYIHYQAVKHNNGLEADTKHREQRKLFERNASCFAVGPFLRNACKKIAKKEVAGLVPGFPDGLRTHSPDDEIVAITFGRLDRASEAIKQGRLAVAAFGRAVEMANRSQATADVFSDARLHVVGLALDDGTEMRDVQSLAAQYARQRVNVIPLPYDDDRDRLFERLGEANIASMLSWHEGFGLTGWEAIAAEIPLILSKKSGLYQLIEEELGGAGIGCLHPVEIKGALTLDANDMLPDVDVETVAQKFVYIATHLPKCKRDAVVLKSSLVAKLGCSWRDTARQFLAAVGPTAIVVRSVESIEPPVVEQAYDPSEINDVTHGPFAATEIENGIAQCAELLPGTTQGSTLTSFDLLPELRFGEKELPCGGLTISFGLSEALLTPQFTDCRLAAGKRLGDTPHPNVRVDGNAWRIIGPKENGVLVRRSLGTEPLARVHAKKGARPKVRLVLTAQQGWITYRKTGRAAKNMSRSKEAILEVFLNKCLGATDGVVTLSRISMGTTEGNDETN